MHYAELSLLLLPELYELAKTGGRDQFFSFNELAKKHAEENPTEVRAAAKFLEFGGYIKTEDKEQGDVFAQITDRGESLAQALKRKEKSQEETTRTDDRMTHFAAAAHNIPAEIQESIYLFRRDYPNPDKVAFIMMRFGRTKAHQEITEAIRNALTPWGIVAVRADDRQYHDDLFPNILTYIYGCRLGIAVFERIEAEDFNPNVSLEIGYMFALKKPVCLLKDRTLKTLQTDLIGKLYRVFDPQAPLQTIPIEISQWLIDKRIVK